MSYYIGVDVGTGSARACIIDEAGEILSIASKPTQLFRSGPDIYEQSTEDIWSAICECTRRIMQESGVSPEHVKGLGFDATCSLAVLNRKTHEPMSVQGPQFTDTKHSVILWADHRARDQADRINATGHNLLRYVGGTMSLEMEMPKILWLKENMPAHLFSQCKFYDLPDYLTFQATGNEARSNCSIVCKMGFVPIGVDDSTEGWSRDFCKQLGLEAFLEEDFEALGGIPGRNGRVLSAGERVGGLTEKAAEQMGLKAGTPVGSGVIDAYAGWAGTVGAKVDAATLEDGFKQLAIAEGESAIDAASHRLAAVAGTSTCHLAISKNPVFVPGVWGPYKGAMIPDYWMAEGGQSATGSLLHHIITTHGASKLAEEEAKKAGYGIFEFLNRRLESIRAEVDAPSIAYLIRHTFLYPDYHGNRSPLADPDMRGVIVGLGMDADIDALATHYYAALEAIGMQTRHIVEALNEQGHTITSIFMSGGQCKNPLLMHLLASCTGLPVVMPEYIDAAVVLGSAFLGVQASTGEPLWDVMARMSKSGKVVYPSEDADEMALLGVKYKVFLDMATSQRRYRAAVDSLESQA
ncbi:hypothetical protein BCR37DRAFT_123748 [Protomyces lactucae-debilis]|uniref:Uncharacterized protein n=1 Tax=Protomyces lactucae-debilis TaxID=2754530 RepID=A0A1Y2FS07_PROLT|nr:uncharacterized protein BCR37DRAFT_123748 [Protomyces lactucae-debilis]ORY86790.1 hypothetical protein BCR37DRAFT_123748 [Protomyces lactucae-debilis]